MLKSNRKNIESRLDALEIVVSAVMLWRVKQTRWRRAMVRRYKSSLARLHKIHAEHLIEIEEEGKKAINDIRDAFTSQVEAQDKRYAYITPNGHTYISTGGLYPVITYEALTDLMSQGVAFIPWRQVRRLGWPIT